MCFKKKNKKAKAEESLVNATPICDAAIKAKPTVDETAFEIMHNVQFNKRRERIATSLRSSQ